MSNFSYNNTFSSDSCRICFDKVFIGGVDLTKDENMLKLFEFCVGISINISCPPKKLCLKCGEILENYVKFKQKCIDSEVRWKSFHEDFEKNDLTKCIQQSELKIKEEATKCDDSNIFCEETNKNKEGNENKNNNQDISPYPMICDSEKLIIENYINDDEFNSENINETCQYETNFINDKNTKKYQCKKCKKEYSKHKWLVTHKMNVCFKEFYKRMINNKKVNTNKTKGLENSDTKDVPAPLSSCGLCTTPSTCDVTIHMDEHWANNDLQCQLCDYYGRDFADMITHSFQHNPKKKLICHVCKKKKASILSLQFHFRSMHLQKAGGICSICNKTFTKFKTWKRHERLHNENSLFICDHCGRKFLYKHEIKSHLIYHTDVRLFVCETCGKGFKRMSGLKDHIENLHRIRQPVKCEHCDKTYKSQSKLEIHLRNVAKDKPFICEVCSKRFISEKVLQKHMFWHTGERPHRCEVCGSRYKAKGQLNIHMRNHTGFMPHKCVDCGKSFPAAKQLKRHQSVHTGVRAYKCEHCERSFHEKKTMLEHATQHKSSQNVKSEN
ncbi:unnamed protein product [Euphydryas editha]|uniref:Uncharacterized protein n=1 Tax=Euphydryas editha TaxID=104508 RepID=A0AAU9V8H9_EUPED|nr:unnamed protein product [Euphydryas editha]